MIGTSLSLEDTNPTQTVNSSQSLKVICINSIWTSTRLAATPYGLADVQEDIKCLHSLSVFFLRWIRCDKNPRWIWTSKGNQGNKNKQWMPLQAPTGWNSNELEICVVQTICYIGGAFWWTKTMTCPFYWWGFNALVEVVWWLSHGLPWRWSPNQNAQSQQFLKTWCGRKDDMTPRWQEFEQKKGAKKEKTENNPC